MFKYFRRSVKFVKFHMSFYYSTRIMTAKLFMLLFYKCFSLPFVKPPCMPLIVGLTCTPSSIAVQTEAWHTFAFERAISVDTFATWPTSGFGLTLIDI